MTSVHLRPVPHTHLFLSHHRQIYLGAKRLRQEKKNPFINYACIRDSRRRAAGAGAIR